MTREFTIADGAAAERLDVFLARALQISRSQVQALIKAGQVQVGEATGRASYLVQPHDHIAATMPEPAPVVDRPALDLPIVYEDADIIVIDKPAGLAAHPGSGTGDQPTVADFSRHHTTDPDPERPGIVHRLDRDTSGLLIIAKTPAAKTYMQQQFRDHAVTKTYQALVVGRLEPAEAVINMPLDRDPMRPLQRAVVPGGRPAVTTYRTLAAFPGYTLAAAEPQTGRTHQIRVHFAAVGHPIAGDITYGAPRRPLGLKRHFLHAAALSFTAPSGQALSLTSPLPTDLAAILETLTNQV